MSQSNKEAWLRTLKQKNQPAKGKAAHSLKGLGPNKACGHKGGISRQGSKRG